MAAFTKTVRPMRGVAPKSSLTDFPYLASVKIDGLRAMVKDGVVYSKTMKPIPNKQVQALFGHLHGADGELTVGQAHKTGPDDDVFDRSRGPIMRRDCDADFQFWIFDRWDCPELEAIERVQSDQTHLTGPFVAPGVHLVSHQVIRNGPELEAALHNALYVGYEGLMLRRVDGLYKYGQSTEKEGHLLKLKPFKTSVAVILGVVEQTENTNAATMDELGYTKRSSSKAGKVGKGTFGAFLARDLKTGAEFSVGMGPGLDDKLRDRFWNIRAELPGQFMDYRFQECGTKNAPRLPAFLRLRDAIDVADLEGCEDRN